MYSTENRSIQSSEEYIHITHMNTIVCTYLVSIYFRRGSIDSIESIMIIIVVFISI